MEFQEYIKRCNADPDFENKIRKETHELHRELGYALLVAAKKAIKTLEAMGLDPYSRMRNRRKKDRR